MISGCYKVAFALAAMTSTSWAATSEKYDFLLHYEGTGYRDVAIWDDVAILFEAGYVKPEAPSRGLPDLLPKVDSEAAIPFSLTLHFPGDRGVEYVAGVPVSSATAECEFDFLPCGKENWVDSGFSLGGEGYSWDLVQRGDDLGLIYTEMNDSFVDWAGEWDGKAAEGFYGDRFAFFSVSDKGPKARSLKTSFEVLSAVGFESLPFVEVAPSVVPLPGAALLLPAGLGGLVLLRRRRKTAA